MYFLPIYVIPNLDSWCLSVVRVHYFSLCYNKDNRQSNLRDATTAWRQEREGDVVRRQGEKDSLQVAFSFSFRPNPSL